MNANAPAETSVVHTPWPAAGFVDNEQTEFLHADRRPPGQAEPLPRDFIIGRYQVISEIARGGMGIVYKAWDPVIGRAVAIKLLHGQLCEGPEFTARFELEARINGRLDHPAIVPVHEVGSHGSGCPYFVMRYIEGRTLASILHRCGAAPHPQGMLLKVFERICQGIAYAHARGIIHRDLKPSNVIVGDFGVINIVDWGLGKYLVPGPGDDVPEIRNPAATPGESSGCTVVGTPSYLPPEQARGEHERVDERADVFCLGGILCHILTGAAPYYGTSAQRLEQAAKGDLASAFARLDLCAAEQELVVLARRCLSPDRNQRPRDASEVSNAITAYLESDVRRAERDLVRFFDLSLDLFCIAGLNGYFRRINPNFSKVLGYTDQEIMERPFSAFIHPDDLQPTADAMKKLAVGRPVVRFTNRYRHASGHYVYLEWAAHTEEDSGGNIYAVARDVTDHFVTRSVEASG